MLHDVIATLRMLLACVSCIYKSRTCGRVLEANGARSLLTVVSLISSFMSLALVSGGNGGMRALPSTSPSKR